MTISPEDSLVPLPSQSPLDCASSSAPGLLLLVAEAREPLVINELQHRVGSLI